MKSYFKSEIRGGDWWLPILAYWFISVVFNIPIQLMSSNRSTPHVGGTFALTFLFFVVLTVTLSLVYIAVLRKALPKISVASHSFSFQGSMGRFLGINALGAFLSAITLMIYLPWWMRRGFGYLVSEATVDGATPEFYGRGGTLFKYLLFCIYIPMIVLVGGLVLFGISSSKSGGGVSAGMTLILILFYILLIVAISFFYYLSYKWLVQIHWNERTVLWKTEFWNAVGMILGQMLLTIITAFIYLPAAALRLYRYFSAKTVILKADNEVGRFGFDGPIGGGFLLLWGQILLSIITIGIYLPWAYARILRWVAEHTYYEPASPATP